MPRHAIVLLASLIASQAVGCARPEAAADAPAPEAAAPTPSRSDDPAAAVARGELLVRLGGCTDCHTPMRFDPDLGIPVPDTSRRLSGHPEGAPDPVGTPGQGDQAVIGPTFTSFRLPFGVVYSANLTSDPETGLGRWTVDEFVATLRTGHRKGTGRVLLPPMPWQNLAGASDEDLRAIYAYLQTVPAVVNHVPASQVPDEVVAHLTQIVDGAAHAPTASAVR